MRARSWERWSGIAGLVFFGAILAMFFVPSTPDIGVADAEIGPAVAADARGIAAGVYVLGLGAIAFAVFASGLATRLRGGEGERAGSSIGVLIGAVLFTTVATVACGITLALVAASREDRDPTVVRALFELDEVAFIPAGFGLALMLLSAAVGILGTRALPAWLGWSAAVLGAGFLVALLAVMSADDEGGPLGFVYFLDLILSTLWVVAVSVVLLRVKGPATAPIARRVATPSA
jgi:hypothetical protein